MVTDGELEEALGNFSPAVREVHQGLCRLAEETRRLSEKVDQFAEQLRRENATMNRETRAEILALAGISLDTWSRMYRQMQESEREMGQGALDG